MVNHLVLYFRRVNVSNSLKNRGITRYIKISDSVVTINSQEVKFSMVDMNIKYCE